MPNTGTYDSVVLRVGNNAATVDVVVAEVHMTAWFPEVHKAEWFRE